MGKRIATYIHEDLTHLLLDLGKLLIWDLDVIKIGIVLIDLTAQDSSTELDLEVVTELFKGLRLSAIVLLVLFATWGIALDGVHPNVGRTGIKDHVEGVE